MPTQNILILVIVLFLLGTTSAQARPGDMNTMYHDVPRRTTTYRAASWPRRIGYLAEFSIPQRSPHDRLPALPHRAQHSARVWWRNKHLSRIAAERSNPRGDRTYEAWYRQGRRTTVDSVCFNQPTPVPGPLRPTKARHACSGLARTSNGFALRNIARPSARVFLTWEVLKER
jgi:hypothetical protein